MEKTVIINGKGANKEEIMKNISDSLDEIFANKEQHEPKHAKKEDYPFINIKIQGEENGFNCDTEFSGDNGEVINMLSGAVLQVIGNLDGRPTENLMILAKFILDRICEDDCGECICEVKEDGESK